MNRVFDNFIKYVTQLLSLVYYGNYDSLIWNYVVKYEIQKIFYSSKTSWVFVSDFASKFKRLNPKNQYSPLEEIITQWDWLTTTHVEYLHDITDNIFSLLSCPKNIWPNRWVLHHIHLFVWINSSMDVMLSCTTWILCCELATLNWGMNMWLLRDCFILILMMYLLLDIVDLIYQSFVD